jgi:3-hydroxyacyl-CoA dehydrogenase
MSLVTITHRDGFAVVVIDNAPVNALGVTVRQAMWDTVEALDNDPSVQAVIVAGAGRTFVAGADVSEFDKPPQPPHLPDLVNRIEAAAKPWLAAMHGATLGGGLELALGCHYRIALPDASFGFPEVTLGVVPGASGTVRTPRLIGITAAIELITSGRPIGASQARAIGLIDAIVDNDLVDSATSFLRAALKTTRPQPISERPLEQHEETFWDTQSQAVARRARGEAAPMKALGCLRCSTETSFAEALAFERATFLALRQSAEALALRSVFFAERGAARPRDLAGVEPGPVDSTAVIGGGTMGAGIAVAMLEAGLPVTMVERDNDAAARGLANVRTILAGGIKRGRLSQPEVDAMLARFEPTTDYGALADADLVVEAVFEDLTVKRDVFVRLDAACRSTAILATNTSYLDPRDIAANVSNLNRIIGLHFFSPANVMKLLEIVPLPLTDVRTRATVLALARRLGKVPVQSGICEGFIGNRILKRYRAEAEALVRRGVAIEAVDAAMRGYGFAMGPFEAQDLGGLDIAYAQRQASRAAGKRVSPTLGDLLVEAGRKGQKTGCGWYDYAEGDRKPLPSPGVAALLAGQVAGPITLSPGEIASQLVNAMADEGELILAERIAQRPEDIDLVEIHGYGFPRRRGGPMHACRTLVTGKTP